MPMLKKREADEQEAAPFVPKLRTLPVLHEAVQHRVPRKPMQSAGVGSVARKIGGAGRNRTAE